MSEQDDDPAPGTVIDAIIDIMAFPRGGGAMMAEVQLMLQPTEDERDGARIMITTGVPWDRASDTVEAVRRRAAAAAHRLLKAAAALSEDQLQRLVEHCLYEQDLPDLHRGRQRH
jgi:hypothetical protein